MRPIERLAANQHYICTYCAHTMVQHVHCDGTPTPRDAVTKDHITPRVYGGPTTFNNLVAACCQCNNLRGEIDVSTFRNILNKWFTRHPDLWLGWHHLTQSELASLKRQCLLAYERQLRGQGIRHQEMAFRHHEFTWRERRRLSAPVCH